MRDLRALPKAELHIHLEGSIRVETLRELADRSGGALPHGLRGNTWRFDGFLDFIQNYTEACALLNRPEDFRRLAEEFCADLAIAGRPLRRSGVQPGEPRGAAAATGSARSKRCWTVWRRAGGTTAWSSGCAPTSSATCGMDEAERTLEVATEVRRSGCRGAQRGRERTGAGRRVRLRVRARARRRAAIAFPTPASGPDPRTSGRPSSTTRPTGSVTASARSRIRAWSRCSRSERHPAGGRSDLQRRDRRLRVAR